MATTICHSLNETEVDFLYPLIVRQFAQKKVERVLFVNPADVDLSLFNISHAKLRRYVDLPPYGLGVLASHLRRIDITCKIVNLHHHILLDVQKCNSEKNFDFTRTWQEKLKSEITEFSPDLIGVTCLNTVTHASFREVCRFINTHFSIPLMAGGVHITNCIENVIRDVPEVDFFFLRESDISLPYFIDIVNGKRPISHICQLIIKTEEKYFRIEKQHIPSGEEFDIIPAYDLMDIVNLSSIGKAFCHLVPQKRRFVTVQTGRGCRGSCAYCSTRNFNGPGVRHRPIKSVIDELEALEHEYGVTHITWLDDDLFYDHERIIKLLNEKIKRGLKLTWDASIGVVAASCTNEIIAAASESGCIGLHVGVESGSNKILRYMNKPGTPEVFLRAAEVLRNYEQIYSGVFLMLGLPNETLGDIRQTLKLAQEMNLDWYRLNVLQPLPNTKTYDDMVAKGLLSKQETSEVSFITSGGFGDRRKIEDDPAKANNFMNYFELLPNDVKPEREKLLDIWFVMNYKLNFERLFKVKSSIKVQQQESFLKYISDVIVPDNAFVLYFLCYLRYLLNNKIDSETFNRLRRVLAKSKFWMNQFNILGLSLQDVENNFLYHRLLRRKIC